MLKSSFCWNSLKESILKKDSDSVLSSTPNMNLVSMGDTKLKYWTSREKKAPTTSPNPYTKKDSQRHVTHKVIC